MKLVPFYDYEKLFEMRSQKLYKNGQVVDKIAGMKNENGKLFVKLMSHDVFDWITTEELFEYTDVWGNSFGQIK